MESPFSLEGHTAIVTGGSRGIGLAIARAYIAAGARVIITARGQQGLDEAVRTLGANGLAYRCDNADPADIARCAAAVALLGPVDILVNNAGISPIYKRAEHVTVEEWDSIVDVNLRGCYFWAVEFAKRLFEAKLPGSIINVSSVSGTVPLDRLGVYATTKAGLEQLTRVLAREWADRNIRVNTIAPGWTATDFTGDLFSSRHGEALRADIPMGRLAEPEDIAGAALYLASPAAGYVTGATITIDGGRALR